MPGCSSRQSPLLLDHLAAAEPELHAGLTEIAAAWGTDHQAETLARVWPTLPKTAIDYAVAEPAADAGDVAVIPGNFTWDDVGDFAAIARLNPAAQQENMTVLGKNRECIPRTHPASSCPKLNAWWH